MSSIRVFAFLTIFSLWLSSVSAFAGQAENFVKAKQELLNKTLKEPAGDARDKKLGGVFDEMLDYDGLATASLGSHAEGLSKEQRKEFGEILRQLVQRAYRKNLDATLGYDIAYNGENDSKDGNKIVKTTASSKKDKREAPIVIEYNLAKVGGKWLVADIVTEGSSLVRNYRRQFDRIIKKDGFDELLKKMKTKLEKNEDI